MTTAGQRREQWPDEADLPDRHGDPSGDLPPDTPLDLSDASAVDAARAGRKAAALARAAAAGLTVLPGFVLPADLARRLVAADSGEVRMEVHRRWAALSGDGDRHVIVRSSSAAEDTDTTSMAGRFTSVAGVADWAGFLRAVAEVVRTAESVPEAAAVGVAVLVQLQLEPVVSGVMFGVDPVSGRSDRVVVSAVRGRPEGLVSGTEQGSRYELDRAGAVCGKEVPEGHPRLSRGHLRRLAQLEGAVAQLFGGPQDVEWALDDGDRLWLLQSRPVTTAVAGTPVGAVLGRGPVTETFPAPVAPLEAELWVAPLRQAVVEALRVTGSASERELTDSLVVTVVDGFPVADLELLGEIQPQRRWWHRLDVRPGARRLRAAWRVGKLRAAVPALCDDVLRAADTEVSSVADLRALTTRQLVTLLVRGRDALRAVHAHEILAGLVLPNASEPPVTGTGAAMRVLADARRAGLRDEDLVARHPVVLALAPPRIAPSPLLPADVPELAPVHRQDGEPQPTEHDVALLREQLRLRARWLQELTGRAAWVLGERLAVVGVLQAPDEVRRHRLDDLVAYVFREQQLPPPQDLGTTGAALPARFRLTDREAVVPVLAGSREGRRGAGGGVGEGPVSHDRDAPPEGAVLVVRDLEPQLAPLLPRLAGLVAENGDPLAHLAILAREQRVPTVVRHVGAREELPEGARVRVDGDAGDVVRLDGADAAQDDREERT